MVNIKKLLSAGILTYCASSAVLTAGEWAAFALQNSKCRDIRLGQERIARDDVKICEIYPEEDIYKNPSLSEVELYCLPGERGERKPYILYIPGGAYMKCGIREVALPSASTANAMGYTAFILKYRVRKHTDDYAPVNDVAAAVKYITENAKELNVDADNYMITGFSAGGNLACLFASKEFGFEKYGLKGPKALTLLYPWTNINAKIRLGGNIFMDGQNLLGKELAMNVLIGPHGSLEEKERLCAQNLVTENYTPCFIVQGDRDFLVPKELNSDVFEKALREHNVKYKYIVCHGLTHGFGIGTGTDAEGWVKNSIEFWNEI